MYGLKWFGNVKKMRVDNWVNIYISVAVDGRVLSARPKS